MDRKTQKEEILSAMQTIAGDISSDRRASEAAAQKVKVDIGGITVKNVVPTQKNSRLPTDAMAADRNRHWEPRSIPSRALLMLPLIALFLFFLEIFVFCLSRMFPTEFDQLLLMSGFVAIVGSLAIFSAVSVHKDT